MESRFRDKKGIKIKVLKQTELLAKHAGEPVRFW